MDSWEWNKIAGAILGTLILILVINFATEVVFEPEKPAKEAYHVEGVVETASTSGTAAPAEETIPDWGTVLPSADTAAGQTVSIKCQQCHDLSKGGVAKIGPPLYGVLGRARATVAGFSYSSGMSSSHAPWTYDEVFKFIKSPQAYVVGTKMTFAGLSSVKDRINLIAYLRTQNDAPPPIPAPAPAKAPAAPAAPAGATAPTTPGPGGKPATPPATPQTK
ncbi:MAG TPA: c-type cytochrome [Rhizomicrobium sp.]|jgi:cytochrome c|nr:c-type cytochrome [Rhizomicrobium sp.]